MKRSVKKWILAALVLCVFVGGAFYLKKVNDYQQKVHNTVFCDVDLSTVPDGIYIGEYDVDFISAKVEVTIEQGQIASINILEHKNDRGQAAEAIIDEIIAEQNLDVDAVSSATNSSTVLKKAVENALTGN